MNRSEPFVVDALALARIRHSQVLAVDPSLFGRIMSLPRTAPLSHWYAPQAADGVTITGSSPEVEKGSQVAVMAIDGPLSQRAYLDLELCGMVDGYDAITDRFTKAINDPKVGALVMRINSPGGDVAGLEEAVRRMRESAVKSKKRVIAYVDELAASAAYWIASGVADEIIVPAMGEVGSIGTIGAWVDSSEAFAAAGHKIHIVRDPEGKAAFHPAGPVEDVANERLAAVVSESTDRFVAAVGKRRKVAESKLRALNGELLRGERAKAAKLADEVGSFEMAVQRASEATQRTKKMQKDANALAILGLTEGYTDRDLERTRAQLEFSGNALKLAETDDPNEARGRIAAWKAEAAKAAELRDELKAAQAAKANGELTAFLLSQVGKKLTPAQAWEAGEDGKAQAGVPHPRWIKMGLAEARGFVDASPAINLAEPIESVESDGVAALSQDELDLCKAKGISPEFWAQSKAKQANRRAEKGMGR